MTRSIFAVVVVAIVGAGPPCPSILSPYARLDWVAKGKGDVAFRPDGKVLAVSDSFETKMWDITTKELMPGWEANVNFGSTFAFSPDGKTLFSVSSSLKRVRGNVATGKDEQIFRSDRSPQYDIMWLVFSPDGKRVGGGGFQRAVIWDIVSGKELHYHERAGSGGSQAGSRFSHDLRLLAAENFQDVDFWDVRTGKLLYSLLDHPGQVRVFSFSSNDRVLAVEFVRSEEDDDWTLLEEVWLWDVTRRRRMRAIPLGNLICPNLAFSPDGKLLAVGGWPWPSGHAQVRVYETSTGRELARQQLAGERTISGLAFRPDGKMLAAQGDQSVRLWTVHYPGASLAPRH